MIGRLREFVAAHRVVQVVGPAEICARLGHVEETTDVFGPGAHAAITGCLRCDATLNVAVHEGRYPLSKVEEG